MKSNSLLNYWELIKSSKAFYSFIGLVVIFVASAFLSADFLLANNLFTILRQASVLLVLSTGLTAVVLIGRHGPVGRSDRRLRRAAPARSS